MWYSPLVTIFRELVVLAIPSDAKVNAANHPKEREELTIELKSPRRAGLLSQVQISLEEHVRSSQPHEKAALYLCNIVWLDFNIWVSYTVLMILCSVRVNYTVDDDVRDLEGDKTSEARSSLLRSRAQRPVTHMYVFRTKLFV